MVLMAIVGELGAGKTLTLTYLAIRQWIQKNRKIYANYKLYGVPFYYVDSVKDIDAMEDGFCAMDEFWLWIDSRCSITTKNRLIGNILLKSRKRGLTIAYTTQTFEQIDKRIRKVTDFIAYPIMSVGSYNCKVIIFRGPKPSPAGIIDRLYFDPRVVYQAYNSNEEIKPLKLEEEDREEMKELYFELEENPALYTRVL